MVDWSIEFVVIVYLNAVTETCVGRIRIMEVCIGPLLGIERFPDSEMETMIRVAHLAGILPSEMPHLSNQDLCH